MTNSKAAQGSTGNVIAAICSVFVPGLGQLVQARVIAALFYFTIVTFCYWISPVTLFLSLIPGGLLHLMSIISAATFKPQA